MTSPVRPYRGLSPQERIEQRRQRLLAAGRECFAEAGDAAPWVGEVCTRAGVSKRHFYELYDDRLDLVQAMHADAMAWFMHGFDDHAHPADPVAWLTGVVPWLFAKLVDDPLRARVLALAPAHLPRESTNLADLLVEGLVRRIRRLPDRPPVPNQSVRRHALGAVYAGRAVVVEWLLAAHGPARERVTTKYIADIVSVSTAALSPVLP